MLGAVTTLLTTLPVYGASRARARANADRRRAQIAAAIWLVVFRIDGAVGVRLEVALRRRLDVA